MNKLDPLFLFTIFLAAIIVGLLASMLGLGGGVLLVPIYTLALNIPIHTAIGTSMVAVIATSTSGAIVYIRQRITNIRLGLLLETSAALGAITGALIAVALIPQLLMLIFAVVLIYVSSYMIIRRKGVGVTKETSPSTPIPSDSLGLTGEYFDGAYNSNIQYGVRNLGKGFVASFFVGNLSAMLGVGGGFANVPLMHYVMKIPVKVATATSNYMAGIIGTAAALVYFSQGLVDPLITVATAFGVFGGAQFGSRLARRTRGSTIRLIFGIILLYVSLRMLLRGIGIDMPF